MKFFDVSFCIIPYKYKVAKGDKTIEVKVFDKWLA